MFHNKFRNADTGEDLCWFPDKTAQTAYHMLAKSALKFNLWDDVSNK